jgi:replicative DNA helicase
MTPLEKKLDYEQSRISYLPDIHRSLPQAPDSEKALLCSFLLAPREIGQMCAEKMITSDHFHIPAHALIFDTLMDFWRDNEPVDFVTVTHWMRKEGTLDQAGGSAAITELFTYLPTAANARSYLETVREMFILREVIKVCTHHAAESYEAQADVTQILEGAQNGLLKVVRLAEGSRLNTRTMKELVFRSMERIDHRIHGDWKIEMPTGIVALDKATLGFQAPTVTMLLGKPSDGKSSLALNICEHLAIDCKKRVGIISMDDSDDQVADRLIQARARVNLWDIKKTGEITTGDFDLLRMAGTDIANASDRLFIRDDGGLTPTEISATLTAWKAKHGLDFAVIDHIQLAQADRRMENRTSAAEEVSRSLKPMAKRLGIPLLVLSQVSEDGSGNYTTKNTRALGEDANNLWKISRSDDTTDAWIHIGKQKDGPRNQKIPVKYEAWCTRFSDRDREPEPEQQQELVHMGKPPTKRRK